MCCAYHISTSTPHATLPTSHNHLHLPPQRSASTSTLAVAAARGTNHSMVKRGRARAQKVARMSAPIVAKPKKVVTKQTRRWSAPPKLTTTPSPTLTEPRRSKRLRNARQKMTNYLQVIPNDVTATIVEEVIKNAGQREALKSVLVLPRLAIGEALHVISEGTGGQFNTVGTKAYKNLTTLMRIIGDQVNTLKFKDKLITKTYSKIVKSHCPNISKLSIDLGIRFSGWTSNPEHACNGINSMLNAVTNGSNQLREFHLTVMELSKFHINLLSNHVMNVNTFILHYNITTTNVPIDAWQNLWKSAGANNVALKKIVISHSSLLSDAEHPSWLCLNYAKLHCPKIKIIAVYRGHEKCLNL